MTLEQETSIFEAAIEKNRTAIDAMSEHDHELFAEGLATGVEFTCGNVTH
jgi:hypothetical protein